MNKERREALKKIKAELNTITLRLESIVEQEEEARDSMPESLQESERYEKSEAASELISSAIENLEEAESNIEEAIMC